MFDYNGCVEAAASTLVQEFSGHLIAKESAPLLIERGCNLNQFKQTVKTELRLPLFQVVNAFTLKQ